LKAVLSAIPMILLIACVLAAFATQDWDVRATLFAEDPLKTAERLLPSKTGAETEFLEVTGFAISEDRSKLALEAVLHSPLNVPVKIKELSAEVILNGSTVAISLPSEVEIPVKGSASLKLEGPLPEVPPTLPSEEKPTSTLCNMQMKLDISGIELEMEGTGLGGR